MTTKPTRTVLRHLKRILGHIREILIYRKLNWNCISKPLKENPSELFNIHRPTIEEYRLKYRVDGKSKTSYDWWYSAILKDTEGKLFFFILAFHPKWSFYRIIPADIKQTRESSFGSFNQLPILGFDFHERMGYSEHDDAIDLWVSKTTESTSSGKTFVRCTIKPGESHLRLKTDNMTVSLKFTSLGMPFWINRGREATFSPKGDTMSGFYDVCQVEGSLKWLEEKKAISGVGINEHLMSFVPPERFWKRIDGVFFCTDQIYCALWYLENMIDTRRYEYKDGAIIVRATNKYLIPIDFKIEYLELDSSNKFPVKTRILVDTSEGKLNVTAEVIGETEKQLALKIIDGQFVFEDGRKLRLTNGYGQHALH